MAPLLRKLPTSQEPSESFSKEDRPMRGEGKTTPLFVLPEMLSNYLEGDHVKLLLRSVRVLDEWLKDNEEILEDEVRVQRVKHWREEALEQLRRKLNLSKR
jgi:hypothetical protein